MESDWNKLPTHDIFLKTPFLKALEESINSAKEQISLSSKWKNPTLTFGATDIQFDDISRRDLEPMQSQFIGFSQVIPVGDKLDIKEKVSKKDKNIVTLQLEDKKLVLKSKIYEVSYSILILEIWLRVFHLKMNPNEIRLI